MDYYSTLGVDRAASPDDIKSAYRKLAMKHHPDRGGDQHQFQKITEAYETLSDSNKKAMYDNGGMNGNHFNNGFHEFHSSHPFQGGDPFGHPFEDIFTHFGFGFQNGQRQRQKNSDLQIRIRISLKDSYMGKTMNISYQLPSGHQQNAEITIPPGIIHGQTLRMGGMGDNSISNISRGDLIIQIEVDNDSKFYREDTALITTLEIDIFDAMLGCTRRITNIDGSEIDLQIKPGTQNGQKYNCQGLGFPSIRFNNIKGDLLIQILVKTPVVKDPTLVDMVKDLANKIRNSSG